MGRRTGTGDWRLALLQVRVAADRSQPRRDARGQLYSGLERAPRRSPGNGPGRWLVCTGHRLDGRINDRSLHVHDMGKSWAYTERHVAEGDQRADHGMERWRVA